MKFGNDLISPHPFFFFTIKDKWKNAHFHFILGFTNLHNSFFTYASTYLSNLWSTFQFIYNSEELLTNERFIIDCTSPAFEVNGPSNLWFCKKGLVVLVHIGMAG